MSRVILAIVYYAEALPTGLTMKLKGHEPMKREFDAGIDIYRVTNESVNENRIEKSNHG